MSAEALCAPQRHPTPWLCIGCGWAAYLGPVQQNRPHSHHMVQMVWSSAAPVWMTSPSGDAQAPGHVVAAGALHHLRADGPLCLLFLDPDLDAAKSWNRYAAGGVRTLADGQVQQLGAAFSSWNAAGAQQISASPTLDDCRRALITWLGERLPEPLRARDAAAAVGLSEGHFLHWFSQVHGLAFRPYVRWLRVQHVLRSLAAGLNLTAAAHAAGFADSAHLSRTFVATFGIAPRQMQGTRIELRDTNGPDLSTVQLGLPICCRPSPSPTVS